LGLTFRLRKDGFRLYKPDGEPIRTTQELEQARIAEQEARIAEQEARIQAEAKTTELQKELNALKRQLAARQDYE
jgi:hypothetical protein